MTGTNDKIRGLFLAALMVMSVFAMSVAFSGSVAAAANARSPVDAVAVDGNNVNGITVHSAADNNDDDIVEIRFNGSVTNAQGNWRVGFTNGAIENATTVNAAGDTVELEFDGGFTAGAIFQVRNVTFDDGTNTGNGGTTIDDSGAAPVTTTDLGPDDAISVTVATSGIAEAGNNQTVWIGETTAIISDSDDESIWIQDQNGNLIRNPSTGSGSQIHILDTSGRSGEVHADFDGNTALPSEGGADGDESAMLLQDLGLSISAGSNNISSAQDMTATVSANTGSRTLFLGVLDSDGDFVSGKNVSSDTLDSDTEETYNFGTFSTPDDYTVYVEDLTTGIAATTSPITVTDLSPDASFASADFADNRGDIVEITVELTDTQNATIQVGDIQGDGYSANISVNDGDGDGEVTLLWNTFEASGGGTGSFSVADSDDAINGGNVTSDVSGHNVSGTATQSDLIAQGTYDLEVSAGNGTTGATADDVATASIQARSTDATTVWTAPSRLADTLTSVSDIRSELGANITRAGTVADNDLVVHQVSASGLEGALANHTGVGDNDTQAFMKASGATLPPITATSDYTRSQNSLTDVWDINIGQANPAPNRDPKYVFINGSFDAVTVVADSDNDTYFVVVDTGDATVARGASTSPVFQNGDVYATNFTVYNYRVDSNNFGLTTATNDAGDPIHETAQLGIWQFQNAEATVSTDRGGLVRVRAEDNQTISGTTTVAPGSQLSVRVQTKQGAQNAFLLPAATLVQQAEGPTNTWAATYDFSDRSVGTEFTVDVRRGGSSLLTTEADGVIGGQPVVTNLQFSDQESTGNSVVVDSVTLTDGGFIAIHQGSPGGDVIGNSGYLEAGEDHTNLAIALDPALDENAELYAMPHLDTNNNQQYDFPDADGPYTEDGSPVTSAASITVGAATPPPTTAPPTTAPPTTAPPTTEPPATETPGQDGPGFGVIISLIALLAAALLAVRRRS